MNAAEIERGTRIQYSDDFMDNLSSLVGCENVDYSQEQYDIREAQRGVVEGWEGMGVFYVSWDGDLTLSRCHSDNLKEEGDN